MFDDVAVPDSPRDALNAAEYAMVDAARHNGTVAIDSCDSPRRIRVIRGGSSPRPADVGSTGDRGCPRGGWAWVCSGLLASLLLALAAPAHAANHQLTGTAFFNPSAGTSCPAPPSAYDSYPPIVMTGSLDGCWYTHIETARATSGGVYLESGTELFVGRLDGSPAGTFTTTYRFEAKLDADGAEVRGRCQHPIVSGSGTGGFAGATRRVDFKDIIGDPITYVYRGHISRR
jgi:hypothetical protein